MSLDDLPREHLLLLHQSVIHSSFISHYFYSNERIKFDLERWEWNIYVEDQLIGNVDQLELSHLVLSLYRRGIYLNANEMGLILEKNQIQSLEQKSFPIDIEQKVVEQWKSLLKQWICIHQRLYERQLYFNQFSSSSFSSSHSTNQSKEFTRFKANQIKHCSTLFLHEVH